jgi:hypothetical protein
MDEARCGAGLLSRHPIAVGTAEEVRAQLTPTIETPHRAARRDEGAVEGSARLRASPVADLWKVHPDAARPATLGMMVGFPRSSCSSSATRRTECAPTVVDESRTSESRALVDACGTPALHIIGTVPDRGALDAEIQAPRAAP